MSTITLRSVKGSGLTNNEIDANFTNLNTDKIEATQTVTLTNKTLALGSNTISGTLAQFNTAVTDADLASLAGTETLTNKTLTSPAINGGVIDTTSTTATAALGTSSTRLANTAFVQQEKEYLPALSQSLHIGAVVKAIVYDTSKDSDGGAWRKRCADKSWYTETLGGDRWIGQHATIAAAWAAAGSTTGAVYQASATAGAQTSGLFYTPTSSTTVTQVYRGMTREFPAVAGIVAESARVVIYDLSNGAMWMVVSKATGYMVDSVPTSICAQNGQIIIGSTGLFYIALLQDAGFFQNTSNKYKFGPNIAGRNAAGTYAVSSAGIGIVNNTVNDVAITVLDNAPIDPATGLPTPTIAVGTAGGTSIIQSDGTVTSVSNAGGWFTKRLAFNKLGTLFGHGGDAAYGGLQPISYPPYTSIAAIGAAPNVGYPQIGAVATGYGVTAANPYLLGGNNDNSIVIGGAVPSAKGLTLLRENPATPAKGMVAYVTTAYNTGWLPGDIRGAYLADTTAETITASGELVTNGTFTTDTTGWDASGATLSVVSGKMRVTTTGQDGRARQVVNTVVGKNYRVSVDASAGTATLGIAVTAGSSFALNAVLASTPASTTATLVTDFVATATTTSILVFALGGAVQTGDFDNISVKLAEPDRSVKNKGLVINGSLTKTAVASGAGLVAWSGFSASNYLEQPYNSDLDFGTGDFCVMGWVNATTSGGTMFHRGAYSGSYSGSAISVACSSDKVWFRITDDAYVTSDTFVGVADVLDSTWHFVTCLRSGSTLYIYIDGRLDASAAVTNAAASLSNASATMRVGIDLAGANQFLNGSLALWRISATAPSADQIAHIYRTELPLFQANAQCTIAGSSTAVTALAYDDTTEILDVYTSGYRSGFKDLLRIDSAASTVGTITSGSASGGARITGGSTSAYLYQPAMLLRDELRRKDEARKALGKVPVSLDFTATASQTAFVLAKGYTAKFVYVNGLLQRLTGQYTVSTDGFQETVTMVTGVPINQYVTVIAVRS